ncbi:hypothetical protein POSPLADRAFT_1132813 [Postia placenta MAD-698-R-SB12]|uniref:ABM domain-containing protein n=1 Tax=Postia placenta MAD-698-R-SB12 TaxID=670580 RepID=A0A1X6NAP9_9APHY|nr:hypothetical protein POSPLADRAFT_1132813 [Postia placenta MAD-698-R-SB12]OSX65718.1 hypothetical protein POSPLADRAFT_1132813 [Postia placenta MAD-698-R-SB12]
MAPIVTEIIHIKINDAFHEKPELHKELREGAAYGGLLHQSYGLGLEDPTQLHWILHFDQGFLPKDFTWPEKYGNFRQKISGITASDTVSYFVPLDAFPSKITSAPVTEIAIMTLKDDVSIEQYKSIADKMIASAKQAPGVHDACYGITEADPHRAYVFVGWDSIDAQHKWANGEPDIIAALKQCLAGLEMIHVKFNDHN